MAGMEPPITDDSPVPDSSCEEHIPCPTSNVFKDFYYLQQEKSLSLQSDYILSLCGEKFGSQIKLGVALSSNMSSVYILGETLSKLADFNNHTDTITKIRFMPGDPRTIISSSLDGRLVCCDSRTSRVVREYKCHEEGGPIRPFNSFDISSDGKVICGGTEVVDGNSYLLFWDTREKTLLGGYWQSHTDDITEVSFHPSRKNIMCSGSTDGLVNIFDIDEENEDDALITCLNTESSVSKVTWLKASNDTDRLGVLTHTEDVQIWDRDGSFPEETFSRSKIFSSLGVKGKNTAYVLDVFQKKDDKLFLVSGTTGGKGELLRALEIHHNSLTPMSNFRGNKQIIRASWYDKERDMLITGGESSILSVWSPGDPPLSGKHLKANKKKRPSSGRPY